MDRHPAADAQRALLTTNAQVIVKGGMLGRVMEPIRRIHPHRIGVRALAAFKALVETGEPPDLDRSRGPIPATC